MTFLELWNRNKDLMVPRFSIVYIDLMRNQGCSTFPQCVVVQSRCIFSIDHIYTAVYVCHECVVMSFKLLAILLDIFGMFKVKLGRVSGLIFIPHTWTFMGSGKPFPDILILSPAKFILFMESITCKVC